MKYNLEENEEEDTDRDEELPSENPFFITNIRRKKKDDLLVPQTLIKKFNLSFGKRIILQDPKGRKWFGEVCVWKRGPLWITKVWKRLCRWNKIGEDDTIICEFQPSRKRTCAIMKVHINRSKQAQE